MTVHCVTLGALCDTGYPGQLLHCVTLASLARQLPIKRKHFNIFPLNKMYKVTERIDSLISFHLSKISDAKFSVLYHISLVGG